MATAAHLGSRGVEAPTPRGRRAAHGAPGVRLRRLKICRVRRDKTRLSTRIRGVRNENAGACLAAVGCNNAREPMAPPPPRHRIAFTTRPRPHLGVCTQPPRRRCDLSAPGPPQRDRPLSPSRPLQGLVTAAPTPGGAAGPEAARGARESPCVLSLSGAGLCGLCRPAEVWLRAAARSHEQCARCSSGCLSAGPEGGCPHRCNLIGAASLLAALAGGEMPDAR